MNWLLENIQLVVILASAFAWWLTQRRKEAEEQEPPPAPGHRRTQFEELERKRRIQEEIRRKIAERRGTDGGRLQPPPVPVGRSVGWPPERRPEPVPVRREAPDFAAADAAALERQRRLEDEIRAAQQRRAEAQVRIRETISRPAAAARVERARPGERALGHHWLKAALRDSGDVRRAIVLREVLGPPPGLR